MIALCFLVPLSRMYLGVHTPLDVGVSVGIALILIFVLHPIFKKAESSPRIMYAIIGVMTLLTITYLLFVCFYSFPKSVYSSESIHNLTSARENGFTLLGCMLGLIAVYTLDLKYTHFKTDAVWWAQGLKILGGLLLVVAAKELLRAPLDFIFGGHLISRSVRYFIMVIIGGGLWPMTFKYFSKLGKNKA
jgi:membrane-associated phospholipid phosphatase